MCRQRHGMSDLRFNISKRRLSMKRRFSMNKKRLSM